MSDDLEVAKECGFFVYESHDSSMCNLTKVNGDENALAKYTSRILASQQAAHEAEIAKLKKEMCALRTECAYNMVELIGANEQLSASNASCAMKDAALKEALGFTGSREIDAKIQKALSATSQQVSEWERKQLEPLRAQVAMLHTALNKASKGYPECHFDSELSDTQATVEQFIAECEQRGAVNALEELLTCDDMTNTGYIHKSAIARRATSKKAG